MIKQYQIMNEVNNVVIGKRVIIGKVLTAILAKGHILLEDYPGVGKDHTWHWRFQKLWHLSIIGFSLLRMYCQRM